MIYILHVLGHTVERVLDNSWSVFTNSKIMFSFTRSRLRIKNSRSRPKTGRLRNTRNHNWLQNFKVLIHQIYFKTLKRVNWKNYFCKRRCSENNHWTYLNIYKKNSFSFCTYCLLVGGRGFVLSRFSGFPEIIDYKVLWFSGFPEIID